MDTLRGRLAGHNASAAAPRRAMALAAAITVLLISLLPTAAGQQSLVSSTQADGPYFIPLSAVGPAALTVADVQLGACQAGAPDVPVVELTIAGARQALLDGRLTCSGLVRAYVQRIEALDKKMQLNAVRMLSPSALQEAEGADELLAAALANGTADEVLPRLFCVPLLLKDNYDALGGMPTTVGTPALLDNYPLRDARVVSLLVQEGVIVLGKANMGEFAFYPTFCLSSIAGVVRNPYNLEHTPAGSSGGSAAAVAASFAMAALGTDTGNSVRGPSSHTGLVGIRPSLGLTSRAGIVPLRMDRDTAGPMARTVEDAVRLLEVMAVPDPNDPISLLAEGLELPGNYTQFLDPDGLAGARIGVLRSIANLPGADKGIQRMFEQALVAMQLAGATLVDNFNITGNQYGLDWDPDRYGQGPALGSWNVNGRWEDLWGCQSPFRVGINAYLASANTSIRLKSLADIYSSGLYHPASQDELVVALRATNSPDDWPTPAMRAIGMLCGCSWMWQDPCRMEFRRRLVESMDRWNVSVLVYPTWNSPPAPIGSVVDDGEYDGNNSPMIAPQTGSPSLTVPMGLTSGTALPVGLSFLGRPMDEASVIQAAYAYEQATQHRVAPVLFQECIDPPPQDASVQAPTAIQQAG